MARVAGKVGVSVSAGSTLASILATATAIEPGTSLVIKLAARVAKSQADQIGRFIARQLGRSYGEKLLARKATSVLPIAGALFGGAFNAWYTQRNADAALAFYRIRYLHACGEVEMHLDKDHVAEELLREFSVPLSDPQPSTIDTTAPSL